MGAGPRWRNGRRSGLKHRGPRGREGSTPSLGTNGRSSWSAADERPMGHADDGRPDAGTTADPSGRTDDHPLLIEPGGDDEDLHAAVPSLVRAAPAGTTRDDRGQRVRVDIERLVVRHAHVL